MVLPALWYAKVTYRGLQCLLDSGIENPHERPYSSNHRGPYNPGFKHRERPHQSMHSQSSGLSAREAGLHVGTAAVLLAGDRFLKCHPGNKTVAAFHTALETLIEWFFPPERRFGRRDANAQAACRAFCLVMDCFCSKYARVFCQLHSGQFSGLRNFHTYQNGKERWPSMSCCTYSSSLSGACTFERVNTVLSCRPPRPVPVVWAF